MKGCEKRKTRRKFVGSSLLALSCSLLGCVSLDQLPPGSVPTTTAAPAATAFPDLEPGNTSVTSLHFVIKGYSQSDLDTLKERMESLYNKIGSDTGLYSFLAGNSFTLVAYRDREEFTTKTHQPTWSHAVVAGKAIYFFYPDPDLMPVLAHQLTHLIFESYVGEKASAFRWVEEGLAMVEELAQMPESERTTYYNLKSTQLRQNRVPFSQMTFFVTNSEEKRRSDTWFHQVESVVSYVLTQGSALAFAQFLNELKSGSDIDHAISSAYSAKFRTLEELENQWKYTI